jgi:cystatin-C
MNRILCLTVFALAVVTIAVANENTAKPAQSSLPGGYSPAEINPEVQKAAEFAVKAQAKATGKPLQLVKILKVEQQVVAGLNYRLEIEVADGSKRLKARAVVWRKLDGSLALTSWE